MEAAGVYWKPVWHILSDGDFTLILANAAHVKNVPGRKTDVADAVWLADLLAHGLIRAQLRAGGADAGHARPVAHPQTIGARTGRSRPAHPEDSGGRQSQARLGADPDHGRRGRAILQALIAGERDPDRLARSRAAAASRRRPRSYAPRCRGASPGGIASCCGRIYRQVDALNVAIAEIDAEVDRDLGPFFVRRSTSYGASRGSVT